MIIYAVSILSIVKDILFGEELGGKYILYLLAGAIEMISFDLVIYHGFVK